MKNLVAHYNAILCSNHTLTKYTALLIFILGAFVSKADVVLNHTYRSINDLISNAASGDTVYLDIDYCINFTSPAVIVTNLDRPDESIQVSSLTKKDMNQSYHGLYGKYYKYEEDYEIYIHSISSNFACTPINRSPITILPKEISSNEIANTPINTYVRLTGKINLPNATSYPEDGILSDDAGQCNIKSANKELLPQLRFSGSSVIEGFIRGVSISGVTKLGINISNAWNNTSESSRPDRTVKVSLGEDEPNRGKVSIQEINSNSNEATELILKDGETAVLKASANSGYEFKEWTLNGQTFTTDSEFEWKVIGNATFEAHFLKVDTPKYVISVECSDDLLGSAEVITSMPVEQGEKVSIKAVAKNGARFVKWTNETGELVSESAETDVYATDNLKYIAHFVLIGPINIITEGEGIVIVSQNGVEVTGNVDDGSNVDIEAVPNNGWKLTKISSGNTTYDSSPVEMTVRHPMEIHVIFEELPTPEPEPLPESVTTVADLRKYATAGAEMRITSPMTVVTHLINGGSEFLATDGSNVVICKAVVHPDVGSVITNSSGTFVDYGSGVLYFQINTYEEGVPEDYTKIDPIDSSVADVLSKTGEYVTIPNVRLGPTKDEQSNNRSYLLVYGKINSNSEPPVKAYCYFDEIGPESLIDNRYYTVTGVVGDCAGEKMLLITDYPVLQAAIERPQITLTASPDNWGKVWIESNGANKGNSFQTEKSTMVILHAEPADGMEFVGWISSGTEMEPFGEMILPYTITSTVSFTAIFRAIDTTEKTDPEKPDTTDPDKPDPDKPDTTDPDKPDPDKPDPDKPDTTDPDKPDPDKPDTTDPDKPDPDKPDTTDPDKPDPDKPDTTDPDKPDPDKPDVEKPQTPEQPSIKNYKVTFITTDNGTISVSTGDGVIISGTAVPEGTQLQITVTPDEGYHLSELKVNGSSKTTDKDGICIIPVTSATVIEAVFVRTIASSRQLRVAVEDWIEGVEMGKVYIDTPGTYYLESQMLVNHTFYAEPASDCKFIGWRVPGTDAPFNVSPVFTYNVRDGLTLIAEFVYIIPAPRIVEVRVSASEKGTATIKEFESTKANTRRYVTLTATPSAPRHMFRDWTDEDGNVVSTEPEFIYSSAAPALLTANFTSNYTLNLATDGPGNLEWYAENTDDATSIAENTRIRITATPEQHYELASISINDADMTEKYFESDGELTIVMNGDKNITARFTPMAYPVRVGIHAHGRIEVVRGVNADGTPGDGKIVDGYFAHYGDVLHIHPIPDDGYQLKEIRVNDIVAEHDLKKGYATHTVDGPASITVDFEAIPSGIEAAERDKESDPYLYDLQGRPAGRRSTARAGLYLMQSPKGWTKILISR